MNFMEERLKTEFLTLCEHILKTYIQTEKFYRSEPLSTSFKVCINLMLIFGPNSLSVSERAYLDDQRTCFRLGGTINLPSPISQYPPSCAGPKTASTEFNCLNASPMCCLETAGISLPISNLGP